MLLGPDEVRVRYSRTAALGDDAVSAAFGLLSADEQTRYRGLAFDEDRTDFAVAHALLRRMLSDCCPISPREWTFTVRPGGKPTLTDDLAAATQLSFNLSHTRGLVACGVTRGPAEIGVDVDGIDRRIEPVVLARRYFSATEVADLERCAEGNRQLRFIEIWTLKEAYIKAIGSGLAQPLDSFGFTFGGSSVFGFDPPSGVDPSTWRFALVTPTNRHRIAVAVSTIGSNERQISVCSDDAEYHECRSLAFHTGSRRPSVSDRFREHFRSRYHPSSEEHV